MSVNKFVKRYLIWTFVIISVLTVIGYTVILSIFPVVRSGFSLNDHWTEPASGKSIICMSVSQDGVILFNTRQALTALQAKPGTILWSNNDLADNCPKFALNDAFITLSEQSLLRVEAKTGRILWQQPIENSSVKIRAASEKFVVLNYASSRIVVYDTEDGSLLWTLPADRGYVDVYIDGDTVFYVSDEIKALNGKTGNIIWEQELDTRGNTLLAEGMLFYEGGYLFDEDTTDVVAFDVGKRQEIWRMQLDSQWFEEILVTGDNLLIADSNYLYALEKQNGRLIWQAKSSSPINLTVVDNNIVVLEGFTRIVKAFDIRSGILKGEIFMEPPQMLLIQEEEIHSWNNTLFLYNKDTIYVYEVKQP